MATLSAIKATKDDEQRLVMANDYIRAHRDAIKDGIEVRDTAILNLLGKGMGITQVATIAGVSTSHVKTIRSLKGVTR